MFAKSQQAIARAIVEAADQVRTAVHSNRTNTTAIPTQTVSRPVRVTLAGDATRAWTVAVTVTEIAQGSVAGTTVAVTDDI